MTAEPYPPALPMTGEPTDFSDTLQAALTEVGIRADAVEQRPNATIVPSFPGSDSQANQALRHLGLALPKQGDRRAPKLDLRNTVGEGAMGVVRLATQRSLGREVVVKTLKPECRTDANTLKLLREAWVTGKLEHPNIVSVHDIAVHHDGSPLIVLQRIEGLDWGSIMHNPLAFKERVGDQDMLGWNLRTLISVCDAVRFAHSRGVLHRDIKPQNVMIGSFGEVYLVDWGIAVSLENDEHGRMPLASDANEMAGTPAYMAPEMLGGGESHLSERTDVYLLGSVLYEIVTGHCPHQGETLMDIVRSVLDSAPPLAQAIPSELRAIIRRAMAPDPNDRFGSVAELRAALLGFIDHRDATAIADKAERTLRELQQILNRPGSKSLTDEEREHVYQLFGQSRFGFLHALEVRPQYAQARRNLDVALANMVQFELAQGEPEAARALLSEMSVVPRELSDEVQAAKRERSFRDMELRRLQGDSDLAGGHRTRSIVAFVLAIIWSLGPILNVCSANLGLGVPSLSLDLLLASASVGSFALLFLVTRKRLMQNRINRRVIAAAAIVVTAKWFSTLVGILFTREREITLHEQFLTWTAIVAMLAVWLDRRLFIPAIAYLTGYIGLGFFGLEYSHHTTAICNTLLLLTLAWMWWKPLKARYSVPIPN